MASLHELDTYENAEPYKTNSRNELHAVTSEKHKPTDVGRSRWIIDCGIIMAFIALCVSVATLVLLFSGVSTSTGLKSAQLDMPTNIPVSEDVTDAKTTSAPQIITEKTPSSAPQIITDTPSPTSRPTESSHENQFGGSTYVRWGRTVCPETSSLVYAGVVGGPWFEFDGSGSNYLCLPQDPEYDDLVPEVQAERAFIYSSAYQTNTFDPLTYLNDQVVPCAVCHVINRVSLMFPAKMTCPSGWIKEYHGYLMAEHYDNPSSTEYVCVDRKPEILPGSIDKKNGAFFYPTEVPCISNLECSPYIEGAELTCVVCSK